MCWAAPAASRFCPINLYDEVRTAAPYTDLSRVDFDDVVDFVATGGYALKTYERFARIKQAKDGRWRVANPKVRQSYRLNVGTIVEEAMLKVRLVRSRAGGSGSTGAIARGGRMLGEIEEYFIEGLSLGDTFVFGGEVVRYEHLAEDQVYVSRANDSDPKVPSYMGGKFPLSTYLAERVRKLLADKRAWKGLPEQVRDWLSLQAHFSRVPDTRELVVETFPRGNKHYLVCYPFEGRLAHQTLGMLLTRRLERARAPAARLCRQRICARDLGARRCLVDDPARPARSERAVRSGHAGRRSRGVAGRIRADEAHLPHLRADLGPDRAALHR